MTVQTARELLTPLVRSTLISIAKYKEPIAIDALAEAGIPRPLLLAMRAHGDATVQARKSLYKRGRIETANYVWAPDIAGYLKGWE